MQFFFTQVIALALAATVIAAPAPKPQISQAEIDEIEANASRPISEIVAENLEGLTAADCVGSTSNDCILAGFSDDPSQ